MTPLSDDPARRQRQLRNLANLQGQPSPGSWRPGDAPHHQHGARSRRPQASPEWSPAVQAAIRDLERRAGGELRDEHGELFPWAEPSIEAVAVQRVAVSRVDRFVADAEARGALKPEHVDLLSRVGERYHRSLEKEAMTLRSRLEARAQTFDLARHWAEQDD